MMPSLNLASDSLGLGAIGSAFGTMRSSSTVQGCGNRPLIGKESKRAFEECVKRQQGLVGSQIANQPTPTPPNNTLIIAIAAVVVVVVLVVVLKK